MSDTAARVTTLFDNATLARIERLRVRTARRFTDRVRGEHLSLRRGMSTEFADYRDYAPGDDTRFLDWNILARLRRPYLKLYKQEEETHLLIFVDASASMNFEGKIARAKALAGVFGVMGLLGNEKVSVHAANDASAAPAVFPPRSGRGVLPDLFAFLEGIVPGKRAPVEDGIAAALRRHRGRGAAVLLSDFLTFGDLRRGFNLLHGRGLEVLALQILGPSEFTPEIAGDMRLVDAETGETLDISNAADLLSLYDDHRADFESNLAALARRTGGKYLLTDATAPLEEVIFDTLRRKGWVR